jgi:type IV pilus assembly protein PilC
MRIRYKAADSEGKISRGFLDARTIDEAAGYLRQKSLIPISVNKVESSFLDNLPLVSAKVKQSDLILFTRQLSSMLSAGLTLNKSLEILKQEIKNQALVEVVTTIINDVEEGKTLGQALEKHPKVFSQIYISIIKAGEQSGLLDKVLLRLSENMEKQAKLKGMIKSALMYPAIVIVMMFIVMLIMTFFVVPQLNNLYISMNVALPLPTKIVIGLSQFIVNGWPFVLAIVLILVYAYKRWSSTPDGKFIIDSTILKLPIFGTLISETILAEFSRTFGLLVGTGTLVVKALLQTSETTGNVLFKTAIIDISKMVEKGVGVGESLSSYTIFSPMLVQLVKIGEETGKIDENLIRASEYFESEVDQTVKNLTSILEPLIMVVLGIGVAFLVFSVITPIYSLINSIQ